MENKTLKIEIGLSDTKFDQGIRCLVPNVKYLKIIDDENKNIEHSILLGILTKTILSEFENQNLIDE